VLSYANDTHTRNRHRKLVHKLAQKYSLQKTRTVKSWYQITWQMHRKPLLVVWYRFLVCVSLALGKGDWDSWGEVGLCSREGHFCGNPAGPAGMEFRFSLIQRDGLEWFSCWREQFAICDDGARMVQIHRLSIHMKNVNSAWNGGLGWRVPWAVRN